MALTQFTKDMNIISALDDQPNDVGGLSAAELKAKFDEGGCAVRQYLNGTLLPQLEALGAETAVQYRNDGVRFLRLGQDRVIETSEDGKSWQASGSSGHLVCGADGTAMPQRSRLQFVGSTVSDNGSATVVQGIRGEKGDKGDKGDQGVRGEKGEKGDKGAAWYPQMDATGMLTYTLCDITTAPPAYSLRGPQGPQGVQGPQGAVGARGPQGEQGPQGIQGARGVQGEAGPAGPAGAQGPAGPAGPQGPKGDAGADGRSFVVKSRYETLLALQTAHPQGEPGDAYAVGSAANNEIYVWDEDRGEWTDIGDLMGPQGPQGPAGPAGPQGAQGEPGPAGPQGLQGAMGQQGPAGPAGPQGDQGPQGAAGAKGDTGSTGPQGPAGPGVPTGGTAGQAAVKMSATDYDVMWKTLTAADVGALPVGTVGIASGGTGATTAAAARANLGVGPGKRASRLTVGTAAAGWTAEQVDYLCDGTADQTEINAAIAALAGTGGEVVLLDGTYHLTGPVSIAQEGVTLSGNGQKTILKRAFSASGTMTGLVNVTARYTTVRGLTLDGAKETYSAPSNDLILLSSQGDTPDFNTVVGNVCRNGGGNGISQISGSGDFQNTISGNTLSGNNIGIYVQGGGSRAISGNTCCENGIGILLEAAGSGGCAVVGNTCNKNLEAGISLVESNACSVTGNTCNENGFGVSLADCASDTVAGNVCCGNDVGVQMEGCGLCTVIGNTCIRGTGQKTDYTSSQATIYCLGANNIVAVNNLMGKNVTIDAAGDGNLVLNNKYS